MDTHFTIFLGGRHQNILQKSLTGDFPRIDYLELMGQHGARVVDFDTGSVSHSRLAQRLQRGVGPYWSLAAQARFGEASSGAALATGEDVGLPMAVLQRLTAARRPVFIITHGSYLGSRRGAQAIRFLRGDRHIHFLCLSRSLQQRLVETHRVPAERVFNVGYGVDTRYFSPAPMPAETPPVIASAGTATRDYKTLTAAATGLDASIKIAADSAWFRSDLDIGGLELSPNVEARSYGDYVGLRRLYAQARFVVVPLYQAVHACGYAVIAEAMAMGKAVITTDIASRSDYVIEGVTGFYVPVGDAAALRERMQYLLDRPALAADMGQQARAHMEANFTVEAYNRRIIDAMGLPSSTCPAGCERSAALT